MLESDYWKKVRPMLCGWDPVRIEGAAEGTPDVNHKHGWIELKWLDDWPVRDYTVVRVDHYTQPQRVWHKRRCRAGGLCHVLIGIGGHSILLWGEVASEYLGKVARSDLLDIADAAWPKGSQAMKRELKHEILRRA